LGKSRTFIKPMWGEPLKKVRTGNKGQENPQYHRAKKTRKKKKMRRFWAFGEKVSKQKGLHQDQYPWAVGFTDD